MQYPQISERTRTYYDYEWEVLRQLPGDDERFDTLYSLMTDDNWSVHDTNRGETFRQVIFVKGDEYYDLTIMYC